MILTLDPHSLYKGETKPKRATKVTVSSTGKVQYHYLRVGGEAPGTPRLRDLFRADEDDNDTEPKEKPKMSEKTTLKRSMSEWEDLFRGAVQPDCDDKPDPSPGQYEPAKGKADTKTRKTKRTGAGLGAVAINATLGGVHDNKGTNTDTDDQSVRVAPETGPIGKGMGWHPIPDQVVVNTPWGEQELQFAARYEDTPLTKGMVYSPEGPILIEAQVVVPTNNSDLNKADDADDFFEMDVTDMAPEMIQLFRGMGFEFGKDKDDKEDKSKLKKKKMEKKFGNWAAMGDKKDKDMEKRYGNAWSTSNDKGKDVNKNEMMGPGASPPPSSSVQRSMWQPGPPLPQSQPNQMPPHTPGQAHVTMPGRESSWAQIDSSRQARQQAAVQAVMTGRGF